MQARDTTSPVHEIVEAIQFGRPFSIPTTLTELDLKCMSRKTRRLDSNIEALCDALKGNATLTALKFSTNGIRCDGARNLSAGALILNSTLTSLDLSHNLIGISGAQALSEFTLTKFDSKKNCTLLVLQLVVLAAYLLVIHFTQTQVSSTWIWEGNRLEMTVLES